MGWGQNFGFSWSGLSSEASGYKQRDCCSYQNAQRSFGIFKETFAIPVQPKRRLFVYEHIYSGARYVICLLDEIRTGARQSFYFVFRINVGDLN